MLPNRAIHLKCRHSTVSVGFFEWFRLENEICVLFGHMTIAVGPSGAEHWWAWQSAQVIPGSSWICIYIETKQRKSEVNVRTSRHPGPRLQHTPYPSTGHIREAVVRALKRACKCSMLPWTFYGSPVSLGIITWFCHFPRRHVNKIKSCDCTVKALRRW